MILLPIPETIVLHEAPLSMLYVPAPIKEYLVLLPEDELVIKLLPPAAIDEYDELPLMTLSVPAPILLYQVFSIISLNLPADIFDCSLLKILFCSPAPIIDFVVPVILLSSPAPIIEYAELDTSLDLPPTIDE